MYQGEQLTYTINLYTDSTCTTPADISAALLVCVNLVLYNSPREVLAKYSTTPETDELPLTIVTANPAKVSLTIPAEATKGRTGSLVFESKVIYTDSKLEDKVKFDDLYQHTLADK